VREAGEVDILVAKRGAAAAGTLDSFYMQEIDRALASTCALRSCSRTTSRRHGHRGKGHLLFMVLALWQVCDCREGAIQRVQVRTARFRRGVARDLAHDWRRRLPPCSPGSSADAGMFADAGVELPPGVGTRSPQDVAKAVSARNRAHRGELDVAPLPLRVKHRVRQPRPRVSGSVATQDRLGGDHAPDMEAGQRDKR